jgi:dCMP deaminase
MSRPDWDECWLRVAEVIQQRSRCDRGVGAVITDHRNQVIMTGYTGPPASWTRAVDASITNCHSYCLRARMSAEKRMPGYADCPSTHAEMNAVARADYSRMVGGTFYVSSIMCIACTKIIANSGVIRVIWRRQPELEAGRDVEWVENFLTECKLFWAAIP